MLHTAAARVVLAVSTLLLVVGGAGGTLLSTWSSLTSGNFSINELDPNTGAQGKTLYVSSQFQEFFAITPGIDYANKRVFLPTLGQPGDPRFPTVLLGFKISGSVATLVTRVAVPNAYSVAVQYDPVTDRVFIVSLPLTAQSGAPPPVISVGYVDLKTNVYSNFTVLNPGMVPSEAGIGGGSSVLLAGKRLLVLGTMSGSSSDRKGYLSLVNLVTGTVTDVPLGKYITASMTLNTRTNEIDAMLMTSVGLNLTFCRVQPTGQVTPVHVWSDLAFAFVVGSLATMDSANNRLYSVMGSGGGPPVALVTIDTTTGLRLNAAYFQRRQPQSLFYLPN